MLHESGIDGQVDGSFKKMTLYLSKTTFWFSWEAFKMKKNKEWSGRNALQSDFIHILQTVCLLFVVWMIESNIKPKQQDWI